ncbi:hypothetical protein, partial [Microvirga aerophila]|uniref:hypothetical protein n=1 Tax=Microvirga aerophila TaxID=670291 RepID=UPI001AEEF1DE
QRQVATVDGLEHTLEERMETSHILAQFLSSDTFVDNSVNNNSFVEVDNMVDNLRWLRPIRWELDSGSCGNEQKRKPQS